MVLFAKDKELLGIDVIAAYKQNAILLKNSRIVWKTIYNKHDINVITLCDFWTNGNDFLIRYNEFPSKDKESVVSHTDFDNYPGIKNIDIIPEDLTSTYTQYKVASFNEKEQNYRQWNGNPDQANSVRFTGLIGSKPLIFGFTNFSFPFFVNVKDKNINENPIDNFFSQPQNVEVLGMTVLNDRKVLVLRNSVMPAYKLFDKVNIVFSYKAWLDVERGYIPLRIEETNFFYLDGKLLKWQENPNELNISHLGINSIFTCFSILQCNNGAFYPQKCNFKIMTVSDEFAFSPKPIEELEKRLHEKSENKISQIEYSNTDWEVLKVETNISPTAQTLALKFPKDTLVYNENTGKSIIIGMTEQEYDEFLKKETLEHQGSGILPDPIPNPENNFLGNVIPSSNNFKRAMLIIGVNLVILSFIFARLYLRWRKSQ
jgi:hypothetical protein